MYGQRLAAAIARDTGIRWQPLLDAFAAVARERFLPPPPWTIASAPKDGAAGPRYAESSEVADICENVSVAIDAGRMLYNGAPGVVASWLDALRPRNGDRCYHAGCATGYYTAILAALVGPGGSVVGVDIDEALVDHAGEALAELPNVSLLVTDAMSFAPSRFDVGLVQAGFSQIPDVWLSNLSPDDGRLVFPLAVPLPSLGGTANLSKGLVFLVRRSGESYAATMIGGVMMIYTAIGAANEGAVKRLRESLRSGDPHAVQSLRREAHEHGETCWLHDEAYCLSTAPPPAAAPPAAAESRTPVRRWSSSGS